MAIEPVQRARAEYPVVRWWVAQTRPQDEQRVADAVNGWLRKHEVEGKAVSPREVVQKTYAGRPKEWTRPIFPQYVFYSGDRDVIFEARQIIRVLDTHENDWKRIANFVAASEAGPVRRSPLDALKWLKNGIEVKVTSGPMQGIEGKVERFGDTTVYLILKLGVAEIDVQKNQIEPLWGD